MSGYLIEPSANHHLDEIYDYTANQWGDDQADNYISGLFDYLDKVASKSVPWRAVPAEFGVSGYFGKYEHHFVYWRLLGSGDIGVAAILHERMHQIAPISDLLAGEP